MPLQQDCKNCQTSFMITDDDLAFYEKISPTFNGKKINLPPPTHCPSCRRQRRFAWRNERTLYQRPCDLCKTNIISVHASDHPYPVYCNPCWLSEKWDPLSYGSQYDPSKPFLEQFHNLYRRTPQRAMVNGNGIDSENCEYTFDTLLSKNCYMCTGMWKAEYDYYCRNCDVSKFCVDCEGVKLGSELAYECINSQKIYHCVYVENSENCNDCIFGFDLKGCSNCIGCIGLRQKKFHIFNKEYSEEEYKEKLKDLHLDTRSGIENFYKKFREFAQQFPHKNMNLQNCENSAGDHLFNCKDTLGYVCTNAQYSKWIERSDGPIWCYDILQAGKPELCYECITGDFAYMNIACLYNNNSRYALYSDNSRNSDHILGCISLRFKKFCILNKEYGEEEYNELAPKILENMIKEGTFGEFFPIEISPYGYNETIAPEAFPMSKEEVIKRGWKWRDNLPYTTGKETIKTDQLPENIRDTLDSITQEILACTKCKRNYKIITQELAFYRNMNLPIPNHCPECRNLKRQSRQNPMELWTRTCTKCSAPISTTYGPDRPETIYCEKCYLEAVY